ncbi:MAG: hypothetical protein LUQ33_00040 [Methanoregulaceae archaeon]|nr:hypothetical protein [Methanoregulaceae archaeon]
MISIISPGHVIIFGLPLFFYLGIVTFVAMITTAILGFLVLRAKYGIKFSWHVNMARATIIIAIIHGIIVIWGMFF